MQLYSTMSVRHGLMNVGLTMTGKTTAVQVLSAALGMIRQFLSKREDLANQKFLKETYPLFFPVQIYKVNAKSITSDELYGSFSAESNEWTDGMLCTIMRECVRDAEEEKLKWIVLDSPVDALWIENLNTILDDAKRLCLTSGEVIAMTDRTEYIFEVRDLEVASPATVSRCGMIYYDKTVIRIQDMFYSLCQTMLPKWFNQMVTEGNKVWPVIQIDPINPDFVAKELNDASQLTFTGKNSADGNFNLTVQTEMQELTALERLRILFNWIFPPVYRQIFELSDKGYKPVIFQKEETIVYNLVKLISSYLHQFKEPNSEETITDQQGDELQAQLPPLGNKGAFVDSVFTFCLSWSLGAVGDQSLRQEFTAIFRHIAYDIPQLLIQNAQVAGVDMNGAKYKFSPSGHKTNQAILDQIALRAQEYQQSYRKLLPIGVPMFAIDYVVPLSPTLSPGQKKQNSRERFVELIQDVCIGTRSSEGDLKGDSGHT